MTNRSREPFTRRLRIGSIRHIGWSRALAAALMFVVHVAATLDAQIAEVGSPAPDSAAPAATAASPTKVGSLIAGTFNDATGHSAQSHLVYAANAGVWWLFTLSSAHDSASDHTVRSYYSSGPQLATATWTAASPSPHLANAGFATDSLFAGGRSLGVAILSIGGADYAHLFASAAFDGQVASNGHIRARLGANAIGWGTWNNPGSPNAASQWQGPISSGNPPSGASTHSSWGNVIGISTGGFIHHSSVTMDEEVDCNAARSTNADIAAAWSNGFGANAVGASPPNTTAVIDKSMTFECKSLAFAPLASDVMLAVYSNGALAQPSLTNLRFQRSGPGGTWTNIAGAGGGSGSVFSTDATVDANDWSLVPVSTSAVYAFRRNESGTGIDGASYIVASNTWSTMSPAPPLFVPGQMSASGAGLFGASDGASIWLFCINNDAASSILHTRFDGTAWTPWTTVPGTDGGTQARRFLSGYPRVTGGQIGLIWTEGATNFDVAVAVLDTDTTVPSVSITSPANGATVSGALVAITASATDDVGAAGVQFVLDGAPLGAEVTQAPYTMNWDTAGASRSVHTLAARARDAANNQTTSATVTVTLADPPPPMPPPVPAVIAPVPSIVLHSTLTPTTVPVTLTWSATPGAGGSAVAGYELQQSIDRGTTWTAIALPTALSKTVVQNIVPGNSTSYLFRVRATDAAGQVSAFAVSAPFTVSAAQESDPNIAYVGSWPIAARTNAFGGSTSSNSVAGSTATYAFTGSYIAWVTEKDPTHGQTIVWIDGVATPMIDNYNSGSLTRRVMFVQALSPGAHTIMLQVLATKGAAAIGTRTDVDAFIVFAAPPATPPATEPTTTTITAAPIAWPAGGTATVTVASTGAVPTGTVTFAVDGGAAAAQPLVNGVATFPIASPAIGTHTLAASYAAQPGFGASSATGTLVVNGTAPAPAVTAPVPSIVLHSTLTTTTVPVTLTWSAVPGAGGSAVAGCELRQSTDDGATWTVIPLLPLQTTIVQNIVPSPSTWYLFRVRATDAAGQVSAFAVSAPFTVSAAQESDPNIAYVGSWPIAARTNAFGGSTSSNSVAGSTATYAFTGSYIAWVTEKDPTHGQTIVWIDGVATPMIDNYNSGSLTRRVMFARALSPGAHTIMLQVLATKGAAAIGTRTDVDAFIVFGSPPKP